MSQASSSKVGRIISFWIHHELIEKLERMAQRKGVTRNAMVSDLIQQAPDE